MVRAKFRVSQVTAHAGSTSQQFVLNAVSPADGEIPENEKYHKYTPSGEIKMTIDNPQAQEQLKLGDYFYVDFTPCPVTK
jgi:hypothetical protein